MVGLIVMIGVVALLLHKYEMPPFASRLVVAPSHSVETPVISEVGVGFTSKGTEDVAVQPIELVTVTIYVPVTVALIVALFIPVDH